MPAPRTISAPCTIPAKACRWTTGSGVVVPQGAQNKVSPRPRATSPSRTSLGRGVPQDPAAAAAWYRKAADQGYPEAQNNLGVMCERGEGVLQDYAAAVSWYRRAAEEGYAGAPAQPRPVAAQSRPWRAAGPRGSGGVVSSRLPTRVIPPRRSSSASFTAPVGACRGTPCRRQHQPGFRKAADQGEATGQYNLGIMYAGGKVCRGTMSRRTSGSASRACATLHLTRVSREDAVEDREDIVAYEDDAEYGRSPRRRSCR